MKSHTLNLSTLLLVAIIAVGITGCAQGGNSTRRECVSYGYYVPKENQQAFAEWITATAKAANPMSDEEGEDLVKQIVRDGMKIFGKRTIGMTNYKNGEFTPYDDLSPADKAICDRY